MKQLTERNAADTGAVDSNLRTLVAGQTLTLDCLWKNTGTEVINSLKVWRVNRADQPGVMTATVGGVAIPETAADPGVIPAAAVEVLSAPLEVGESVAVTRVWTHPAGSAAQSIDSADLYFAMS